MTNTYFYQAHSWVIFNAPLDRGTFASPCPIVHHTGRRVWVGASYLDEFPSRLDVARVGDGKSDGCDETGCFLVSVHVSHVKSYLTDEEAQHIFKAIDASRRLLSHAR